MTNKPDLTNYPDWVHWIAQDADGSWWGFEVEPHQYHAGWYENELGRSVKIAQAEANRNWADSLVQVASQDR